MQHETVKIADMLFAAALPAAPGLLTAKRGLPAAKRFGQAAKFRKGEKMHYFVKL